MNQILTRMLFRTNADARSAVSKFFSMGRAQCGEVTAGSGEIHRNGKALTITQSSQSLCMEWPAFYIEADETVRLQQPNAAAIALIRVTGQDVSKIMGQLQANGQVFLINPNGVLFGKHAQVDVTGLVASALELSDEDFLEGKRTFSGESDANVANQGALIAMDGGYIALLGHQVKNQGTITANMGSVALVAGSEATLEMSEEHLLDATVKQAAYAGLAENQGQMLADGGHVLMTASTRETPFNTVLRNEGVIQAQTASNQSGSIRLLGGEEGITVVDGKLDASAPETGDGGHIETCGAHVKIMDAARILTTAATGLTGQWLVDPADFTVAPEGGDITGAALSAQLNTTNVTLQSSQGTVNPNGSGNIYINDVVVWGASTTLTLEAVNDINIDSPIQLNGTEAGLILSPGSGQYNLAPGVRIVFSSPTAFLRIAGFDYTIIRDINALQSIPGGSYGSYALGLDLDAAETTNWNGGAGFSPIPSFLGRLDGLGHIISNLVINRPTTNNIGLFAENYDLISNVRLQNSSILGGNSVGTLVGLNSGGIINNCFASGTVAGTLDYMGGLVGTHEAGRIENSFADVRVNGSEGIGNAGGLVGYNSSGTIYNCRAIGPVTGLSHVGGLVGYNYNGTIENSYVAGAVNGQDGIGGLAGYSYLGTISNCFASGNVSGDSFVGGLVGSQDRATVNTSYVTGNVTGTGQYVGGLIGRNDSSGFINNSYAAGTVSGDGDRGGLVGYNSGTINTSYAIGYVPPGGTFVGGLVGHNLGLVNSSFWDIQATGQAYSEGGSGLTTAQMMDPANFIGFDFTDVWRIYTGHTYPLLRAFLTPLTIITSDASKIYDGTPYTSADTTVCEPNPCPANHLYNLSGVKTLSGQPARNVGTYQIVSDAYSDQQGYDINTLPGTLTVTPAPLTITAVPDSKVYDGTTVSHAVPQVAGLQDGDTISNLTQSFTTKYAGVQGGVDVDSGYVINDGNNGQNYVVTTQSTIGYIQRRRLTVTDLHALDKVYDGTNYANIQGGILQGIVLGDDVSLVNGVGKFDDKNVGTNKPVTLTGMSLAGRDSSNYVLQNPPGLFASITPAPLTVTGMVVQEKTYDGTNTATLQGGTLVGVVSGDDIRLIGGTATFNDRNAGTNKPVAITSLEISGADIGNYILIPPIGLTGTINPRELDITLTYHTKVYDGTTISAAMPTVYGLVNGDTISNLAQSFDNRNAGRHHMVLNSGYVINDGNGGNNYTVVTIDGLGTISPASLTIAAAPDSKVYDGTIASSGSPRVYGLVNGDTATDLSQAFDSRNAGPRILMVNSGYVINDGNGGNNYSVSLEAANGTISQAPLLLSAVPDTKVYDGTILSSGMPQASGLVGGDTVSGLSQSFDSRNAGARQLVVNGGYVINDGNGGNNYAVTLSTAAGQIVQAPLAISAMPDSKVYDGTTTSRGIPQVSGLVNGDTVTNLSQAFDNRNAGNRALVVNGNYSINDGNGGNNYAVVVNTAMGTIDPAILALAAVPDTKVYDGTTISHGIPLAIGLVAGDTVTIFGQVFDDKNAGARTLVVTGYALSDGNLGNNYRVMITPATGEITPAQLLLSAAPDIKVYDGTNSSQGVPQATGLVNGDTVTNLTQMFDSRNAGSRSLMVNPGYVINDGNGGNNYQVTLVSAVGSIDKAPLTISAVSENKTYDGTALSQGVPVASGLVNSDTVTNLSQVFDSRNAGNRLLVVNSDYIVNDGNGGSNYAVTLRAATGTIQQALLTIAAVADTKVYDGTTVSSALPVYKGLVGSDTLSNLSQSFDSRNAGARTLIVNAGYVLNDGNGGNNYAITLLPAYGTIDKAQLLIPAVPDTKTYDGTTTSTKKPTASGLVNGDTISNLSQSFDSKNAGSRLLVINSGYIIKDGNSGNNYAVTTMTAPGTIKPKVLTVTGQVALNKTYDGSNLATLQGGKLVGVVSGDNVTLINGTATFNDENVGTNKPVAVTGTTLSGTDAGNYLVTNPVGLTATIYPAALTISAVSDSKVYDGTTTSTKIPVVTGLVNSDTVSNLSQSFDSKNAGSRTLIVDSGYTINDGNSGGNYTVTTKTATGSISKAALKLQAVPDVKVFDNTTLSNKIPQAIGLVTGDTVSNLTQTFDKKTPGIRTLLVNKGYVLNDGNNGNNYTVTTATASGFITPPAV